MESLNRIIGLLTERGIEQKTLSDYLGISAQAISQWKSGANKSYIRHINKIAEFFNVSADYLLGKDEIKNRPTPDDVERFNIIMKDDKMRALIDMIAALPPEAQEKVAEHVELMRLARMQKDE